MKKLCFNFILNDSLQNNDKIDDFTEEEKQQQYYMNLLECTTTNHKIHQRAINLKTLLGLNWSWFHFLHIFQQNILKQVALTTLYGGLLF